MLLRTLIRSSAATYLLPFLLGFVLIALNDDLSSWVTAHYWLSVTGTSTFTLPFVSAACAAVAAWEGARLHRGRVFDQAPVRSQLAISLPVLLPVAVMGLLGMLAALFAAASAADVGPGLPHPGILTVILGVLLANTLVGYIVGRVLSAVLAVPLALIGSFFAGAYPSSWSIFWMRHLLGGALDNCCAADGQVDARALAAPLVFTGAVIISALLLIQLRGRTVTLAAAAVVTAAGIAGAGYLARDLGPDPVTARPTSALQCQGEAPRICLWPEVEDPTGVARQTRAAVTRLTQAGLTVPTTLTMAAHPAAGAAKLGIATNPRPADIPGGVASGLLPTEPPQCARDGQPYPGGNAMIPLTAWLYATAGEPADSVAGRFGPQDFAVVQPVLKQPRDVQLAWYRTNLSALSSCGVQPQLAPKGSAS
ncbi:hypothetical protein ABT160_31175 [Streptomyces sp. NPDC001941]|uniref:DUF7224 domain-containing protein n=1 Tax=Streptomyces sp. NPDC001941 TaxID=3154659 RepID=UPI003325B048